MPSFCTSFTMTPNSEHLEQITWPTWLGRAFKPKAIRVLILGHLAYIQDQAENGEPTLTIRLGDSQFGVTSPIIPPGWLGARCFHLSQMTLASGLGGTLEESVQVDAIVSSGSLWFGILSENGEPSPAVPFYVTIEGDFYEPTDEEVALLSFGAILPSDVCMPFNVPSG